jgi:hypothetical protein
MLLGATVMLKDVSWQQLIFLYHLSELFNPTMYGIDSPWNCLGNEACHKGEILAMSMSSDELEMTGIRASFIIYCF